MIAIWILRSLLCTCVVSQEIKTFSDTLLHYDGVLASYSPFYERSDYFGFWHVSENYGSKLRNNLNGLCPPGCICNLEVLDCSGLSTSTTAISIRQQNFHLIQNSSFPGEKYSLVTELSIVSCPNFFKIESFVLEKFPNIKTIVIDGTSLITFPAFQTVFRSLTSIDIYRSKLSNVRKEQFSYAPYLQYLNLAENEIKFVADSSLLGTSLRLVTFAGNELSFVPNAFKVVSSTLEYLGLESNNISVARAEALSDLSVLKHLNISNNPIDHMELGVFGGCTALSFIELHSTKLVSLNHFSFYKIPSLKYVSLYRTPTLSSISGNAFTDLPTLSIILLQYSGVYFLDYRMFNSTPKVQYLVLDDNKITAVPHLLLQEAKLSKLKWLGLRDNKIAAINDVADDQFLPGTQILKDQYQILFPLNKSALALPKLKVFDLSGNRLIELPDYFFTAFSRLKELLLDNNFISDEHIKINALTESCEALEVVRLSNNNLKTVPSILFRPPNIGYISLNQNLLTFLESGTFSSLTNLTELYLATNNILTIEDGTFPSSLNVLELQENKFNFLDENQFNNMPLLTRLDLRSNRISELPDDVFANNVKLDYVNLDSNRIGWINKAVFRDTPLEIQITVSNNELKTIEHGTFSGKDFVVFSADNNQLSFLPTDCMFCNLTGSAVKISLQQNRVEFLHSFMFSNIPSVHSIDLSENLITDIMANSFNNIGLTHTIDLSDNPVNEIESYSFNKISGIGDHSYLDVTNISPYKIVKSFTFNDVSVQNIDLALNNISKIEREAFNNVNVADTLALSAVHLKFIAKHAAVGYFKYINLQDNELTRLVQGAFEKTTCHDIDLSSNKISFVDKKSLPDCTNMIKLDNNLIPRWIKDIIVSGENLKILSFKNNKIREIEEGALSAVRNSLTLLDLSENDLPSFEKDVISNFAAIETLNIGNNNIRNIEAQTGLVSLNNLDFSSNNGRLKYFSKSIFESIAAANATSITISNTVANPIPCSCSNFEAFSLLSENYRLNFDNLDFCEFEERRFSFKKDTEDYFVSSMRQLLCEPQISLFERVTTKWVDDLPTEERLDLKWKLGEVALWNKVRVFCCNGETPDNCLTVTLFRVKCYRDDTDELITEQSVPLSRAADCDSEFTTSIPAPYTDVSIACSVDVTTSDKNSPPSPFAVCHPENKASVAVNCQKKDFPLSATFFDFDNNLYDFQNSGDDDIVSGLSFVNHLLGPFVYGTSTSDPVSRWFTVNSDTKGVLQQDVCLDRIKKNQYKWFARNWYPLDHLVSTGDLDRDEHFIAHNLYFTARVSFPLLRTSKNQEIRIGGPDDVWVFVGGVEVLELLSEVDDNSPLPCGMVAITSSGVSITLGTLDFASSTERCVASGETKKHPEIIFLVGTVYPVDIFLTQRRSLSSSLYLELKNIEPSGSPAPRFWFDMSESKPPGGLIAKLDLLNDQGISGPYTTKITLGKEYFVVKPPQFSYLADVTEVDPTTDPGQGIPAYYDCSGDVTTVDPLPQKVNSLLGENSVNLLLVLRDSLDFDTLDDSSREFLLSFSVSVTNFQLEYSFETTVLVTILDSNDNCPVFVDSSDAPMLYESLYALSIEGKRITATDADSSENKVISYHVGEIRRPINESFYTSQTDHYIHEKEFVDYTVTLHAVDNGDKKYGSSTEILISLSTSCIRDLQLVINRTTGLFLALAPGWMVSGYNGSYCESCTVGYRCPGDGVRIKCTTCEREYENNDYTWPEGVTRSEPGCDNLSRAEFSFGGSAECQACKAGWVCQEGRGSPVLEDMKYVDMCTNGSCNTTIMDCEPGYSCIAGVAELCQVGTYNDGTFSRCRLCPPGMFTVSTGSSQCSCCPEGSESSHGKDECKMCVWNEMWTECGECRPCLNSEECPCVGSEHGCYQGQQCVNLPGDSNECLDCPAGSEPRHDSCSDVDECERYEPCFQGVTCINLSPGFKCDPCPSGYSGTSPHGIGPTESQECYDVNECDLNNGGCDLNSLCINIPGSVKCGICAPGLIGSGETACSNGNLCQPGKHRCDGNAICIHTGPGSYRCQCEPQFAGDGFTCGLDSDLDGYPDTALNCNGTVCVQDNCPLVPNPSQMDTDSDNVGDVCDGDMDGDMIVNDMDTCPYTEIKGGRDRDKDGVPDVCDNCVEVDNHYQQDSDGDGTGDHCQCLGAACFTEATCEDTADSDGDGIYDACDNCPLVPNSFQGDIDGDGVGDRCDEDVDEDGVPNSLDNCPHLPNPDQTDTDGDLVGDQCDDSTTWPHAVFDRDSDGDGVIDLHDNCPTNPNLTTVNFVRHSHRLLSPEQKEANWVVSEGGRTVQLVSAEAGPTILLSQDRFEDVDYSGTFYTPSPTEESGYIGLVLSYQDPGNMYLLVWRRGYKTWLHGDCGQDCSHHHAQGGTTGLQVRRVHISTTDKDTIDSGLWLSSDSEISTLLWQDPNQTSWAPGTSYRWVVSHRPSTGSIEVRVYTATDGVIVNSGKIFDLTLHGGKIGVYNFHQSRATWTNIAVKCAEPESYGISLSKSHVTLTSLLHLNLTNNFVISAWIKTAVKGVVQPVLCTSDIRVCLFLDEDLKIVATHGQTTVKHETPLSEGVWNLVGVKVDLQEGTITVFRDRSQSSVHLQEKDQPVNTSHVLYLGTDTRNNFTGKMTDVRVISRLLTTDTISVLTSPSLARERKMGIVSLHLTFRGREMQDPDSSIQVEASSPSPEILPVLITGYLHRIRENKSQLNRRKRNVSGYEDIQMFGSQRRKRDRTQRRFGSREEL